MQALYAQDLRVSGKPPKVHFQNFAAFESAFHQHGILNLHKPRKTVPAETGTATTSRKAAALQADAAELPERRFLPHQMAIQTGGVRNKRHTRNLLLRMSKMEGPLALLMECVTSGQRVHVKTRREHGIRGSVEGQLLFFDKHWNLVLRDAVEVWQRRKHKYSENKTIGVPQDCSERLRALGIELPAQQVKSVNRKNVQIRREMAQLYLRGEHVAVIVALKKPESSQEASK